MAKTHLKAGDLEAVTFARFMRALRADNFRAPILWLMLAAGLLSAWLLWLFLARVTVREVTDAAHLEANPATIASLVRGRVVASTLAIGKAVHAGDVLVELAAPTERLHLKEERARLAGIPPQLDALAGEIAAQRQAITDARQASRASLDEARARLEAAEEAAQYAKEVAERLAQLGKDNAISELAILRSESKARSLQAATTGHRFTIHRSVLGLGSLAQLAQSGSILSISR
jgi:multidrug resistance efflux pump